MNKYLKTFETYISDKMTVIGYHGSPRNFYKFDLDYINLGDLFYGYGIYFTDDLESSKRYGKVIKKCELKINNSLIINLDDDTESLKKFMKMRERGGLFDYHISPIELTNKLKQLGYDSVVVEKNTKTHEIVVFDIDNIEIIETIYL